jgi:hypothetical protein
MSPSTNGWQDEEEDEREGRQAWEETQPFGMLDPWEDWPQELAGPEYWLNMRDLEL